MRNQNLRKTERKKEDKKKRTYINPKLKLHAMEIFSANLMFNFQIKIHGRRAK